MNKNETRTLLQIRRELTGENFNDGTIDAWQLAINEPFDQARDALAKAAREHGKVTVAHIVDQFPKPQPAYYHRELPPDEEEISLDEYLRRLQRRADAGDIDAQHELPIWRKHASGHMPVKRAD